MEKTTLRNVHVPLPQKLYSRLKAEAVRAKQPAATAVREAIELWLRQKRKAALHKAIARYAAEVAGSHADLDKDLESAAVEHLLDNERAVQ
jgi:hypothetical protein